MSWTNINHLPVYFCWNISSFGLHPKKTSKKWDNLETEFSHLRHKFNQLLLITCSSWTLSRTAWSSTVFSGLQPFVWLSVKTLHYMCQTQDLQDESSPGPSLFFSAHKSMQRICQIQLFVHKLHVPECNQILSSMYWRDLAARCHYVLDSVNIK